MCTSASIRSRFMDAKVTVSIIRVFLCPMECCLSGDLGKDDLVILPCFTTVRSVHIISLRVCLLTCSHACILARCACARVFSCLLSLRGEHSSVVPSLETRSHASSRASCRTVCVCARLLSRACTNMHTCVSCHGAHAFSFAFAHGMHECVPFSHCFGRYWRH